MGKEGKGKRGGWREGKMVKERGGSRLWEGGGKEEW